MKRNGLKKMFLGVAAGAMMLTSMAMGASAATTYTDVTANFYVPASENKIKLWNAYFTSDKIPPRTGATHNATVIVDGTTVTVTFPVENGLNDDDYVSNGYGLALLADNYNSSLSSEDGEAQFSGSGETVIKCTKSGHSGLRRYTTATFTISNAAAATQTVYQYSFDSVSYHAKVKMGIISNDSIETTGAILNFDLSTATATSNT